MNSLGALVYLLCAVTLVSAFYILLQPFIKSMVRGIILQSVLVGVISFIMAWYLGDADFVVLGVLVIVLRGTLVSYFLEREIPGRSDLFREATNGLSSTFLIALVFAGIGIFVVYFFVFYRLIPEATIGTNTIIAFPFVLMFLGIYLILSRTNTLAQIVGYVEGENSMVLMSIFLVPVPFIIELSVFLDVIAMVVIAAIVAKEKTDHLVIEELRG